MSMHLNILLDWHKKGIHPYDNFVTLKETIEEYVAKELCTQEEADKALAKIAPPPPPRPTVAPAVGKDREFEVERQKATGVLAEALKNNLKGRKHLGTGEDAACRYPELQDDPRPASFPRVAELVDDEE